MFETSQIGLPIETVLCFSESTRKLYDLIFDYCTYSSDPQYKVLHKFRGLINRLANPSERKIMIGYFNHDPAIRWNGMPCEPWEYYKDPY